MSSVTHNVLPINTFPQLSRESLQVDRILASTYAYEQNLVVAIGTPDGSQILHSPQQYAQDFSFCSTKIERMEHLSLTIANICYSIRASQHHVGPITAHLFIAPETGLSFKEHTDPDDVLLYMVEGRKLFVVAGREIWLETGESLFIPANTLHQAFVDGYSLMLSIGLESWIEEKL
jgi:mannose-6-phosphate isomerase-like protein (cupin superfamily)